MPPRVMKLENFREIKLKDLRIERNGIFVNYKCYPFTLEAYTY